MQRTRCKTNRAGIVDPIVPRDMEPVSGVRSFRGRKGFGELDWAEHPSGVIGSGWSEEDIPLLGEHCRSSTEANVRAAQWGHGLQSFGDNRTGPSCAPLSYPVYGDFLQFRNIGTASTCGCQISRGSNLTMNLASVISRSNPLYQPPALGNARQPASYRRRLLDLAVWRCEE